MKSYTKTPKHLINNIKGQLDGISKMIEEEKDCFSVMTQMKAVRSAMNSFMTKYVEENFSRCLKECNITKREELSKKFIEEIIKKN